MKNMLKRTLCLVSLIYLLQLVASVFFIRSFNEDYQIGEVEVQLRYADKLWPVYTPALGAVWMFIHRGIKNLDVTKELCIRHGHWSYQVELQDIWVDWQHVNAQAEADKIILSEETRDGNKLIMVLPQASFLLGE